MQPERLAAVDLVDPRLTHHSTVQITDCVPQGRLEPLLLLAYNRQDFRSAPTDFGISGLHGLDRGLAHAGHQRFGHPEPAGHTHRAAQ